MTFMTYLIIIIISFPRTMISYNIITGDTLTKVFMRIQGERHFVILMSTLLFTLPLSLYRDIAKLGKVSLLSMLLTLVILITVVVRAATLGPQIPASDDAWVFARWNAIQAVAVMSFGEVLLFFMIYGSLQEPTLSSWSLVTHVSGTKSTKRIACFPVVFLVQGDIFENYCRNDNLATFGRFCYGVSIITTFPLECFVTREVISNVFFKGELSNTSHVIITLVIISAATAISLSYDCLGIVLELNGVLSAIPLMFIFPAACFLKLSDGRCCILCRCLLISVTTGLCPRG
uniref:Putative sodium-coupled neutral amino acid transporter 11 n=1 Tax=Sinocyclocheilus rhinocerous TaxID=307959 RepID=A0A673NCQ6_9TELE